MNKKLTGILILTITLLVATVTIIKSGNSYALSGSQFQAGNIISDNLFYTGNSMTANQIQSFLNAKVPVCDTNHTKTSSSNDSGPPYTCLKNYSQTTPNKSSNSLCKAYNDGTGSKSSARIIYEVGKACGISQKVLLVLLEKEQSLVTDTWPWDIQYRSATGYGCPDTAACSSQYYGFFNQVYNAAKQFKNYKKNGSSFNYKAGRRSYVQWHPKTSCGGSQVTMHNHATAGLYNYTPYRPNQAALNNLYGTGNDCSSYGNRNFWRIYYVWFGNPVKPDNYRLIICDSQKYMVERWKHRKRLLTSNAIREFNFDDYRYKANNTDRGCDYPSYSNALDTIARSRDSTKSYMLNSEEFNRLQSRSIAHAWGYADIYDNSDLKPRLDGETISDFQIASKTPRLAKSANTGKVYLLDDGKIYHLSGTPSSTNTLRLVRGDSSIPMDTFSGEHLSYLKTNNGEGDPINASFRVNGDTWYLFDYGKVRKVSKFHYPNRWNDSNVFDGPDVSIDVAKYMHPTKGIGKGFQRNHTYYIIATGGDLLSTQKFSTAYRWGVTNDPKITVLLRDKIRNATNP